MVDTDAAMIADRQRRLKRVARVARFMDTAIRVPGTGIRFGGDSIVGLIPGVGDAGTAVVGLYIVNEARRLGLPPQKITKMLGNLGFDFAVGSVPVLGDAFDVFFKAHRRNLDIILEHFGEESLVDAEDVDPKRMKDITPKRAG